MSYSRAGRGRVRPLPGPQIDRTNPLTVGLKSLVLWNEGSGSPIDLARKQSTTVNGTPLWSANSAGVCSRTDEIGDYWSLGPADLFVPENRVTVLVIHKKNDTTNRDSCAFGLDVSTSNRRCSVHLPYSDGTVYFDFGGEAGANRLSAGSLTFTGIQTWAFVAGTKGSAIYQNGKLVASQGTAITRLSAANNFVLNRGSGSQGDLSDYLFFAMLDAEWSADMVKQWHEEPYSFVTPPAPYRLIVEPVFTAAPALSLEAMTLEATGTFTGSETQIYSREIGNGPPMRGAPWLLRLPVEIDGVPLFYPLPAGTAGPALRGAPTEIHRGPPMRGAPWLQQLPVEPIAPPPPPPAASPPDIYPPELFGGPPLRGAPWLARTPMQVLIPELDNPVAPPVPIPGRSTPFVERVPRAEERLRRHTEKVATIINSLLAQGYLIQTGQDTFGLRGGAFTAERPPTATDDLTVGIIVGAAWVDTSAKMVYFCVSNARNAAEWKGPY